MKKIKCVCASGESENFTMSQLSHHFLMLGDPHQELNILLHFLETLEYRQAIIFVRDPIRCAHLANYLTVSGHPRTVAIHGDMPLELRRERHKKFQQSSPSSKLLVTTTCCNHGMECRVVDIIINFDEAETPALYNHRICSKDSRKGLILTFVRKATNLRILEKVQKLYNVTVSPLPSFIKTATYVDAPESDDSEPEGANR